MTTCLGKSCSFGLPSVSFVNCCQFMHLVYLVFCFLSFFFFLLGGGGGGGLYRYINSNSPRHNDNDSFIFK